MDTRISRFTGILPGGLPPCTIVGVGAIGRQVALCLAAMGCPELQLIDPDTVTPSNLGTQLYRPVQLDRPKVCATADDCNAANPDTIVRMHPARYARNIKVHPHLFCCVDDMDARRFIFTHWWDGDGEIRDFLFIDTRMAAEVAQVFTVHNEASAAAYAAGLFPQSEAISGGCTTRSTLYCAQLCASLAIHQLTRHLRRIPLDAQLTLNLLASSIQL